jgi:NAD(P)H-dependent FMN reductase
MKIVLIAGSPRKESLTRRVQKHLRSILEKETHAQISIVDMAEIDLPNLQGVWTNADAAPPPFRKLAETIFEADAFILVTPEYNGSYTPAMKNLLDHFPKQKRKAFGLVTASPGALGGMRAAQQLLMLVPGLFGIASPHLLIVPFVDKKFDEKGLLLDETFAPAIKTFVDEFLWLAKSLND